MIVRSRARVMLLVALLAACSTSPPSQFYTLTAASATPTNGTTAFAKTIAVGPVSLPEAVNRPQFVVRDGANRVVVMETRRWAEPLKSGIAEAVADDLSRALGGAQVTTMSQSAASDALVFVALDVQRFDLTLDDAAGIDVVWTIKRRGEAQTYAGRTSTRESARSSDAPYDALVAAITRAFETVSRDVAAKLTGIPTN